MRRRLISCEPVNPRLGCADCGQIESLGGLKAIVISHPHYYTTHISWARAFNCHVYLAYEDQPWLSRVDTTYQTRRFLTGVVNEVIPGVHAIKCGGHFEGSLVLHWQDHLFIADTMNIVPSGLSPGPRHPRQTSFSFMWSIPNMIPLSPNEMRKIWQALEPFSFHTVHGAFVNLDIRASDVKDRILQSMKIQTYAEGHPDHPLMSASLDG